VSVSESNVTELAWKTPLGNYELTYFKGVSNTATGNDGVRFIAANVFDAAQVKPFLGRYLTSVTAYISQYNPDFQHTMRLSIFYGNDRINQSINSYVPNAWNTFVLTTPLLINDAKELKFGIDVIDHEPSEWPIGNDDSGDIDVNGNWYSEDNGTTWQKLFAAGVNNNWAIIGDITDTNVSGGTGLIKDENLLGYIVYRNNQNVSHLLKKSKYSEAGVNPELEGYSVSAYYNNGYESKQSASTLTGINFAEADKTKVNVFPNPSSEYIRINGNFIKAVLLDVHGKILLETTENSISIASIPNGIYLLKIESEKQITTCKIIKK
jgi:hypothetical protein